MRVMMRLSILLFLPIVPNAGTLAAEAIEPLGKVVRVWGQRGSDTARYHHPTGIACHRNAIGIVDVVISDTQNDRIKMLTGEGIFLDKWGTSGSQEAQFQLPMGLVFDPHGRVLIADSGNHSIQITSGYANDLNDLSGLFVARFGRAGSGDGEFESPTDLALTATGLIYVVDSKNHRVQKFGPQHSFLFAWGSAGNGEGQFNEPTAVDLDSAGNVYITDTFNHRVQKFDSQGNFLLAWGSAGSASGQFQHPRGLALDADDNVYVVDSHNHRVQKFDAGGRFLGFFGTKGHGQGELFYPHGVAVDDQNRLYVTDSGNHRIQVFDAS